MKITDVSRYIDICYLFYSAFYLCAFFLQYNPTLAFKINGDIGRSKISGHGYSQQILTTAEEKHIRQQRSVIQDEQQNAEEYDDTNNEDNTLEGQNFFQSFAPLFSNPPLGHSRPLLYPEHSFRSSYRARDLPFTGIGDNLLGSGNFGVVKGGTYYASDRDDSDFSLDNSYSSYLGNSHARPAYYKRNPLPAYRNGGDFFANFRDFADITAPTKSAFSQYYVVYANKNSTIEESKANQDKKIPRNIIEQLAMIDNSDSIDEIQGKKSEIKKKLETYKRDNENKDAAGKAKHFSSPKEIAEPLLALS